MNAELTVTAFLVLVLLFIDCSSQPILFYVCNAYIERLGLTITKAAKILGVTRQTLNNIVNGRSGISPEMAVRLDKAFGGGAKTWLRLQVSYDLAQVMKRASRIKIKRVRSSATSHASSA